MDRVARGGKADFLRTSCESSLTARGGCGCPDACTRSRSGRQRSRWCIRRRWFRAPPYSLHGLNAVYLPEIGWHRIDARGNKSGVQVKFCPPVEKLAFSIQDPEERDAGDFGQASSCRGRGAGALRRCGGRPFQPAGYRADFSGRSHESLGSGIVRPIAALRSARPAILRLVSAGTPYHHSLPTSCGTCREMPLPSRS